MRSKIPPNGYRFALGYRLISFLKNMWLVPQWTPHPLSLLSLCFSEVSKCHNHSGHAVGAIL